MNVRISTGKCYAIRSLHLNDDNPTMPFIFKIHRGLETPMMSAWIQVMACLLLGAMRPPR